MGITVSSPAETWTGTVDSIVEDLAPQLVSVRRRLHQCPEPSGEERETTAFLESQLRAVGISSRRGPEDCGLIADSATGGSRIAIRGDIDALRMQDEKTAEYRSQRDGVMHGCGHDLHAACALGAALALAQAAKQEALPWPVPWRLILQPAEETALGALAMIKAGALVDVREIIALHADPTRDVGTVGLREGSLTAACDWLDIEIRGSGGHAARPHEGSDPIAAAAQLISAIYAFIPRSFDSHDPVVVTIGKIKSGYSANVIPGSASLSGTMRTLDHSVRRGTQERLRQLCEGVARASGSEIEVLFSGGLSAVINDSAINKLLREAASGALGADNVREIPRPSMGGEDFAGYLDHVPGAMFRLGVRSGRVGGEPLHSPLFDVDERALAVGAKVLARTAVLSCGPDHVR